MFIADFHIHSRYSRATSRDCVPEMLDLWARRKGLDLIGTGDFTHPAWREELKEKLTPAEEGLYTLRENLRLPADVAGPGRSPRFIVSGEISSIYKKAGKVRKIHNLILLPSLDDAEKLAHRLEAIGNLHSDGRPILGLDSRDLLEITLEACPSAIFIPAHIWTPHFSLFGEYSGFDTIEECFGDLTEHIFAVETGLSSDPPMNWRLSALDRFTLVSNSDAHSPANLAREANLFDTGLSYPHIARALQDRGAAGFAGTIEFFPEEGKYHYDGHRNCKVCYKPSQTLAAAGVCPVCGKRITVGVLHRVEELADRPEGFVPPSSKPYESLIPLKEVIAASAGLTTASRKVQAAYMHMLATLGPEFFILRQAELHGIERITGQRIAEGIRRLRAGKVEVSPGYDGAYGKIRLFDDAELCRISGQLSLFPLGTTISPSAPAQPAAPARAKAKPAKPPQPAEKAPRTAPGDALDGLNEAQREAACASAPILAVIAGPGTGKTHTLVSRIAYLVRRRGVPPSHITAVTFTNRAAEEMRTRLKKALGNARTVNAMTIGTFHSICLKILARGNARDGLSLIDEPEALSILEDVRETLHGKGSLRDMAHAISLRKSGAELSGRAATVPPDVYDLYQAQLARYGALDYDDILLRTLALFETADAAAMKKDRLFTPFSYLLVDEFQDINPVQYRLIRAWGQGSDGIFVIGDPDQSIYGFRGSDSRCFSRFLTDFPAARAIHLTKDYRSTPEIVACSRSVIDGRTGGPQSGPGEGNSLEAQREPGLPVRLLTAGSDFSQAVFVAKEINRMVGGIDMLQAHASPFPGENGRARGFSDIAVLYRTNRQAAVLEECLTKEGIPYTVAGRDDRLADRDIRQAVAFFRFLLNPGDLPALSCCMKEMAVCPVRDVPAFLARYAQTDKTPASLRKTMAACFGPDPGDGARRFFEKLDAFWPRVAREKPSRLVEAWVEANGSAPTPGLELLAHMAVLHESMPTLLQNLLTGQEGDLVRSGGKTYTPDAVSLMTLHAAKGLEFPVVFLCGVRDGVIPLKNHAGECDLDEERRLLYVGMTRARDELLLLTSSAPSPFLSAIPASRLAKGSVAAREKSPEFEQTRLF